MEDEFLAGVPETEGIADMLTGLNGIIELGGPVVVILLALSVFALAIVLLKLWQFASLRARNRRDAEAAVCLWRDGRVDAALSRIRAAGGPVARVVAGIMDGMSAGRPEGHVRESAEQAAQNELSDLRSYLRAVEMVAQAAPLIGLLGTVLGMIEAFRVLEASGGDVDPAGLAGGIWVALLTTAVGLCVAIPFSMILAWFDGRIDREKRAMETLATQVLTHPPAPDDVTQTSAPMAVQRFAGAANAP